MILSRAKGKFNVIYLCFALLLCSKVIPFFFVITFFPSGSTMGFGFPVLLGNLIKAEFVKEFSHYVGVILQCLLALKFSELLFGRKIILGRINIWSLAWAFASLLLAIIGPTLVIWFVELVSGNTDLAGFKLLISFRPIDARLTESSFMFGLFFTAFLAPITEEIIYRGFMSNFCLRFLAAIPSGLLVSLVFMAMHYQTIENFGRAVTLFLLGLLLFAARIKHRGIGTPILMHFSINFYMLFLIIER